MLRIKLSYVYDICKIIYPLTQLEYPIKEEVVYRYALNAYDKLGEIYFLFNFKSSFDDIENLKTLPHDFLQNEKNLDDPLNKKIAERIKSSAVKLEFSLKDELAIQPSYLVTVKEGYDIDILTINPSKAFPHLVENFPETEYDVIQCGLSF